MKTVQFFLTPAGGKAFIAKVLMRRKDVLTAMQSHTLAIVAGTTNTYIAREALRLIGEAGALDGRGFYRGIVKPGAARASFPLLEGDVIIRQGKWLRGSSIQATAKELGRNDLILKGANAVHLSTGEAGVLIANPAYGTMAPVSEAVLGRGARLIIPTGVEKRVTESIFALIQRNNASDGLRLSAMPGRAYTELDAIAQLGGMDAAIVAGGGVCGYEGGCYFCCSGSKEALEAIGDVAGEALGAPLFVI